MTRRDEAEVRREKDRIKAIMLAQQGEFTAYYITNKYFEGREPTKREWERIHRHVRDCFIVLHAQGRINLSREEPSRAPVPRKMYRVVGM